MKSSKDIKTIAVIGAGTMGQGIAFISAKCGIQTLLYDVSADAVDKAESLINKLIEQTVSSKRMTEDEGKSCLNKITFCKDFSSLKADVIIEAVIEKLEVKQQLFNELAIINEPETIFASNTSSIPLTRIARGIPNEGRVVGMHFFNPAHIMKLVEVISGAGTDPAVATCIFELAERMGKTPVYAKDAPGFIVNRVARHYYVEALKLMEENVASFETIDRQMESLGFKMGPFKLMDLIGVDTNFSVTSSMFNAFHQDAKFRPSRIQEQKVDAGHHGKKSGKGFYDYGV
jgi:3-hydroxybutyryl-CoA dehydrogenase